MKTTGKVSFEARDLHGHFQSIRISVVFHLLSFWEEVSGTPWAPPVPGGRLCPCPKSERVRMTQVSTDISHLHLRTHVDDSPLQIPHKEGGKEQKKQNKTQKKGQETINFTVITLRQNIPSVHCKKHVKAKLKREKSMLHELQCNCIIPSLAIFLPPHLVQFRKRIEYNTVR